MYQLLSTLGSLSQIVTGAPFPVLVRSIVVPVFIFPYRSANTDISIPFARPGMLY